MTTELNGTVEDAGKVTLRFEPAVEVSSGVVAYCRMPIKITSMITLNKFIEKAYGQKCNCTEEPKGWLKITKSN